MPKMNPVVHFEMPYKDSNRVSKFYSETFGWQMNQLGAQMGNYVLAGTTEVDKNQMAKEPGAINGGFFEYKQSFSANKQSLPSGEGKDEGFDKPSVVISVDDLEESMAKIKETGGEVLGEPMSIPGIGTYIAFHDTEGNRVGMLQPVAQ